MRPGVPNSIEQAYLHSITFPPPNQPSSSNEGDEEDQDERAEGDGISDESDPEYAQYEEYNVLEDNYVVDMSCFKANVEYDVREIGDGDGDIDSKANVEYEDADEEDDSATALQMVVARVRRRQQEVGNEIVTSTIARFPFYVVGQLLPIRIPLIKWLNLLQSCQEGNFI